MQFTDRAPVSVALVYQSQVLHEHLRAALDEVGAHVVYETATSGFDAGALAGSGASVVVINLDPAIDEEIEQIEDLLADDSRKVIFNDGEVTSKLGGWDLARWARHLAAKITGDTELLPARPAGAEAVPVRDMPQHALDSTFKPASLQPPVVTGEAEARASREISAALSTFSADAFGAPAPASPARNELEAALQDFGFFSDGGSSTPVNDMTVEPGLGEPAPAVAAPLPARPAAAPADALFADFDFSEPEVAAAQPAADAADAFADIQFDFDEPPAVTTAADVPMGLDDFLQQHQQKAAEQPAARRQPLADTMELPVPASIPTQTRNKPAIDVESLMSGLSLELSPLDDGNADDADGAAARPAPVAAAPAASGMASDFDDILNSLSLAPIDEPASAAPAAAASAAAASPKSASGLALALEPVEVEDEVPVFGDAGDNPFSELEFGMDDAPAARAPAVLDEASDITADFSRVWVLGASIGGPDAVREFLAGIPRGTRNLFLLAQHMGADFLDLMVSQLAKATPLEVKMASSGSQAHAGQVLVVPLAERLLIGTDGEVRVVPLDEATPYSPSIDQVLFDAADRFGARAGTIIFSGMAHDAIEGAKYLAARGGTVWAQDPATCVVSSMIDGAIEAGVVRYQGGPADLARKFVAEMG